MVGDAVSLHNLPSQVKGFKCATLSGMTRGRKPKATAVAEANGSFNKNPSRRPTNVIKSDSRIPLKPDFVAACEVASATWDQTVDVLKDSGILSRTDTHLLTTYVTCYAEWTKAYKHVAHHGHVDENGKTSPESMTYHKLSDRHPKLMAELGLSPSSRARLSTASPDKKEDEGASLASIISALKG